MATKKAAKKVTKAKRPPRSIWITWDGQSLEAGATSTTKAGALAAAANGERVVGPYVLAERTRER